jgi:hypothetical protein
MEPERMDSETRDIHAAKMRLSHAGERLETIRRLPKQTEQQRQTYRQSLADFWRDCAEDRQFLKGKGITRWPKLPKEPPPST